MAEDLGEVVAGFGHRPDDVAAGVVEEAVVAVPLDRTQGRTLHGAQEPDLEQGNTTAIAIIIGDMIRHHQDGGGRDMGLKLLLAGLTVILTPIELKGEDKMGPAKI